MTISELGLRELLARPASTLPQTDVLLAPARVGPESVAAAARRLDRAGSTPIVVVYAEEDFEQLEAHVRVGHEFLVPPFLPALVHSRLHSCSERAELGRTLREADARAEQLSNERELAIGREIQAGFLPDKLPEPEGWNIDVTFRPARQVAGDFYDVFEVAHRRRLALVVADVCDKGVGAALFMAMIRSLLRHAAEYSGLEHLVAGGPDPIGTLPAVGATPMMNAVLSTNGYLARNHLRQGYFATLFFCVLDPATGSLVYINGGHNAPQLINSGTGALSALEVTGPAVGVLPDGVFSLGHAQMEPGDILFMYTDGVSEARCPDGRFLGEERMLALLAEPASDGRVLLDRVDRAVSAHTGLAEQHDDVTMMALHRKPLAVA
ncbi:PP2C family protein-serine/threonine phosphatase [Streptacidiphilus sp. N1-3]|uniref:PP2C family protein-serine/threonine phosphatase n=1 Tax=Streptacidiphilus alkalitolerans TaxID=3342712 RepID=A0ABV6WVU1_9ACTN